MVVRLAGVTLVSFTRALSVMRRRPASGALLLIVASATLTACGSDAADDAKRPDDPAQAALFDKALEEGEVYVYSNLQDILNGRLSDSYASEIGLPLTIEKIASSSITARYEAEADADAVRADVLISSDCDFVQAQVSKGTIVSASDAEVPGFDEFPEEFKLHDGSVASIQINPWGIGYNSDKVDAEDAPTTWDELLEPKWKGRILMVGPDTSPAQTQVWNFLLESRGKEFVEDLAEQVAQFYPGTGPAAEALIAGEGDLLIPTAGQVTGVAKESGAPVGFNLPDDTTGSNLCAGISSDAPHPEGARLFLSHLLSAAGSKAINVADYYSVGPFEQGVAMPSGYVAPATVTKEIVAAVADAEGRS